MSRPTSCAENDLSLADNELLLESDYMSTILNTLNGFCKVNLEVPQTKLFFSSDSLLPINAKIKLSNKEHTYHRSNTPDHIADVFKNVVNLQHNDNIENIDLNQLRTSNQKSVDQFQMYSEPPSNESNSCSTNQREEKKKCMSPKNKKRKTKYNKLSNLDPSQDLTSLISMQIKSNLNDLNCSDKINRMEIPDCGTNVTNSHLDQNFLSNDIKNLKNTLNNTQGTSTGQLMTQKTSDVTFSDKLISQSECPLCFGIYPTSDIEAHASECNI
ncbi:uncharacterized protein LOC126897846 isoform X1 [Daktulosphaira vitifoliae]|uniref:uncharacterized protein LOC126897846 isoform X1 n=1 Tax=Daktulosphaira vitifoliae TaxID=58002 RepID=UPI0021AA88CE|nr:uncharacterized protein LOC126897846 isoform X1 [Daktulosphaira vitifoliae]XP_050527723.1 uncharacterized protein LOC126897846 isoform X1 [Daktulosphaira vitifoliae]